MKYGFGPFKKGANEKGRDKRLHLSSYKEVVSSMTGTCAKCGTALVVVDRKGSKQGHTSYVCFMHPDFVAGKVGKCPVCGMSLSKVDTEVALKKG
ncbi:MAG: heavy metal-binding domain-containing protein [Segetibacter sp.]